MDSGVYLILNIKNGKGYVGQSKDIQKRKYKHFQSLKNNYHHNHHLQNAWNKYGEKNFIFLILEKCDKKLLKNAEIFWINFLDTFTNGYNLTTGGETSPMLFQENCQKLSQSQTGSKNHNFGKGDSGIAFVYKSKEKRVAQGYVWVYKRTINGKKIKMSSTSLLKLKQKVTNKGLAWQIVDNKKAKKSFN